MNKAQNFIAARAFKRQLSLWVISAVLMLVGPASGQTLDQCQNIIGIHRMMLDFRTECRYRLRQDTSDLAYQCAARLPQAQIDRLIADSRNRQEIIRRQNGRNTCAFLRREFAPLIAD